LRGKNTKYVLKTLMSWSGRRTVRT